MSFREIISWIATIVQAVSAALLIIAGVVLVWKSGFPASTETLSSSTATTGMALVGIGIAIGSVAMSEYSQKELLEAIKDLKK
jgi:hypothetical protein